MVTFPEENFPSVFSLAVAEDWREVDEAGVVRGLYIFFFLQFSEFVAFCAFSKFFY